MGQKEQLPAKLKTNPKDFTFSEAESLLETLGCRKCNKGKTSGSRIMFTNGNHKLLLHKPHPRKELLAYQITQLKEQLEQEGWL